VRLSSLQHFSIGHQVSISLGYGKGTTCCSLGYHFSYNGTGNEDAVLPLPSKPGACSDQIQSLPTRFPARPACSTRLRKRKRRWSCFPHMPLQLPLLGLTRAMLLSQDPEPTHNSLPAHLRSTTNQACVNCLRRLRGAAGPIGLRGPLWCGSPARARHHPGSGVAHCARVRSIAR
jgi:hypothetical protein